MKQHSILITGATGSFGVKFIKNILKDNDYSKIVIFSRDELKQFEMQEYLNDERLRYFLGDVRDYDRLNEALKGINIVVHAAALKQVPSAEYNPMEIVKTNIHGAENIIKASLNNNVDKIIALSTDKASNPANLYGATKLVSDKLFVAANNIAGYRPSKFSVVRYGNVAGSRGSIIPLFKKINENNKEFFPITDNRMTRFWITLDEGVQFVKDSINNMYGGEIFIPKIPSVKVIDIAKAINPNKNIKIIGIRPGEKLHEIMFSSDDAIRTLEFKNYFVVTPTIKFYERPYDFISNPKGEKGIFVKNNFEYSSHTNDNFLNVDQIKKIIDII